jgi:hypothetical protein
MPASSPTRTKCARAANSLHLLAFGRDHQDKLTDQELR